MREGMYALYFELWYRNVLLKARQYGFTSFFDLYMLDMCLFHPNLRCGIIAHNIDDAKVIFRDKVQYPFDNLYDPGPDHPDRDALKPVGDQIRDRLRAKSERTDEILFSNNSSIRVSTSMRSGTIQILHVSEMGKIAKQFPDKAKEIRTGAFEAVPKNGTILVESTAEGQEGEFFTLCQQAIQDSITRGKKLSTLEFKFHFHPWWNDASRVDDPTNAVITARHEEYFLKLESKEIPRVCKMMGLPLPNHTGTPGRLSLQQKAWYVNKEKTLGADMKREHPSTPEEAFEASIEGAYFAVQMNKARQEGRIGLVPVRDGIAIDTYWDIGRDRTSIWFIQDVGRECHAVDYYTNTGEGMPHYINELNKKREEFGWIYGVHKGPHDLEAFEWGSNKTRRQTAEALGYLFDVVPRIPNKDEAIEAARNVISYTYFDERRCSEGIKALDNYRKQWDEKLGTFKKQPLHDWASHGADAFMTFAAGHEWKSQAGPRRVTIHHVSTGAWT